MQASQRAVLRPKKWAKAPATSEEMKAPSVSKEPISCWNVLCDASQALANLCSECGPTNWLSSFSQSTPYLDRVYPGLTGVLVSEYREEPRHGLEGSHDGGIEAVLHVGYGDGGADEKTFPVGPQGRLW